MALYPRRLVVAVRLVALATTVAALLTMLAGAGPVGAEEDGLLPSFGDGRLVVLGAGFQPGERVRLTVSAGGTSSPFTVTADAEGRFRLETGRVVRPCAGVELTARGDQGTTRAAITAAPGSCQPPGLPDTGAGGGVGGVARLLLLTLGGTIVLALAGSGLGLVPWPGRRRARRVAWRRDE